MSAKGQPGKNQNTAIRFDDEQVERILVELAVCAGSCALAERRLAEAGLEISTSRLNGWKKNQYAERYQRIRRDVAPQIQTRAAQESMDLAIAYADAERATLAVYNPAQISGKDLPGAIRRLAVAKAVNIDKALVLDGQPGVIVERRDPQQILDGIAARFPQLVVDAEAIEEPARELEEQAGGEVQDDG